MYFSRRTFCLTLADLSYFLLGRGVLHVLASLAGSYRVTEAKIPLTGQSTNQKAVDRIIPMKQNLVIQVVLLITLVVA